MSLTSRVANLFFSEPTNPREDRNCLGTADDGLSGGKRTFADVGLGTDLVGSETMPSETLEEEGRPPYLHVS